MKVVAQIFLNTCCFIIIGIGILLTTFYALGIVPTIVTSGSMEPLIPVGSLCFIDTLYPMEELQLGDIIVYKQPTQKVIHRIVGITKEEIRTKGDANNYIDGLPTTKENYYGKYLYSVPKIGYFIHSLQEPVHKISFIGGLVILFILTYCFNKKKEDD